MQTNIQGASQLVEQLSEVIKLIEEERYGDAKDFLVNFKNKLENLDALIFSKPCKKYNGLEY